MSREIQDRDFMTWEVYASSGRFGMPDRAHIVFHCLTDATLRARFLEHTGGKAEAESFVAEADEADLEEALARAQPLP